MYIAANLLNPFRPAVIPPQGKSHVGSVDQVSLAIRVTAVGVAAITLVARACAKSPHLFFLALPLIVGGYMDFALTGLNFEKLRAERSIDQQAAEQFMKCKDSVPGDLMDFMVSHPLAIKHLDLSRCDLTSLRSKTTGRNIFEEIKEHHRDEAMMALIDLNVPSIEKEVLKFDSKAIAYAVEKGVLKPEHCTADQIVNLFAYRVTRQNIPVLISKGFDIHTVNSKEERAIDKTVLNFGAEQITALFNNGSLKPNLDLKIGEGTLKSVVESSRPWVFSILEQVDKGGVMPAAVGHFGVDEKSLQQRMNAVFTMVMAAAIIPIFTLVPLPLSALPFLAAAPFVFTYFDKLIMLEEADKKAQNEFQRMFPSHNAFDHILESPQAIDKLPANDLFKLDDQGDTLWEILFHQRVSRYVTLSDKQKGMVFEKLASRLVNENRQRKLHCFHSALKSNNEHFVSSLLSKGIVKDLSPEEQFACWNHLWNPSIIGKLKEHGFDINAKNKDGLTPLMKAVDRFFPDNFPKYQFIIEMLQQGADVAYVGKDGKSAKDFAKEQPILDLLSGTSH